MSLNIYEKVRGTALGLLWLKHKLNENVKAIDSDRVVLFGHLGLGDQISLAPTIEYWSKRIPQLILPVRPRNESILRGIYSYVDNVSLEVVDEPTYRAEKGAVQNIAQRRNATVFDAGRNVYEWAVRAFPEFGINRCLSVAALDVRGDMRSVFLRENVLSSTRERMNDGKYAFIDHHPGTDREIPQTQLQDIEQRGLDLVFNSLEIPFDELAQLMSEADELHLVSSAPLCLALTCDLGSVRVRYRTKNMYPLKLDYPDSWREYRLDEGECHLVDRTLEYEASSDYGIALLSRLARELFLRSISEVGQSNEVYP